MIPSRKVVIEMTIGFVVMAGSVQAATFINTCPFVITSPGDYLLSADLICGGGNGITILSSNVSLRLEGHRITTGVGANQAILVNGFGGTRSSVRILGPGLITNGGGNTFSAGVTLLGGTNNVEVSGITVLGSSLAGISCGACNFSTIRANTLGRNATGIFLSESPSNTISDNDISGNGRGIWLSSAVPRLVR